MHLQFPHTFSLYSASDDYDPKDLARWFEQNADEIAKRFDARNETDYFARTLAETPDLRKLMAPYPLGA